MEDEGINYTPKYFEKKVIEETGESIWQFNGKYWVDRANRDWSKLPKIFE
jgi:hypothetical protein